MITPIKIIAPYINAVTYILPLNGKCILIDCCESEQLLNYLNTNNLSPIAVLLTHSHFDHIEGLNDIANAYPNIRIITNDIGSEALSDPRKNLSKYANRPISIVHPVEVVEQGFLHFEGFPIIDVIPTPGHSQSCLTYRIENCLFTGDSYIPGINTVTNLPGSNRKQAKESEELIHNLISQGMYIYPGHIFNDTPRSLWG